MPQGFLIGTGANIQSWPQWSWDAKPVSKYSRIIGMYVIVSKHDQMMLPSQPILEIDFVIFGANCICTGRIVRRIICFHNVRVLNHGLIVPKLEYPITMANESCWKKSRRQEDFNWKMPYRSIFSKKKQMLVPCKWGEKLVNTNLFYMWT